MLRQAEREIHLESPTYKATAAYLADMVAKPWEVRSWEE
jgi:quinol monooxygenase YgiN